MASVKNTIVLGCFMVLCTVLFIVFNPNRHQLVLNEDGLLLRNDGLTGKVQRFTRTESDIVNLFNDWHWVTYPETKSRDN